MNFQIVKKETPRTHIGRDLLIDTSILIDSINAGEHWITTPAELCQKLEETLRTIRSRTDHKTKSVAGIWIDQVDDEIRILNNSKTKTIFKVTPKIKTTQVAIFARVSTDDGRQNTRRQIDDLKGLCKKQGWTVAEVITENISGAANNDDRAGLQDLFTLAGTGRIDKVVITEVSRLGRTVSDGIQVIDRMTAAKVSIYIQNIGMETLLPNGRPNFMFKPILLTLIGFAEMERELLRERIRSGLKAARKKGKKLGRPAGSRETSADILDKYPKVAREIRAGKLSVRQIAKVCDVSPNTVQKVKSVMG